jgi:hypothetical protein
MGVKPKNMLRIGDWAQDFGTLFSVASDDKSGAKCGI